MASPRYLLIFGIILPLVIYLADNYLLPGKFPKETPLGITQPKLVRS
jgi:hypothetical protein